jgi:hypothetical protein
LQSGIPKRRDDDVSITATVKLAQSGLMIISGQVRADQVDIEPSKKKVIGAITVKMQ